MCTCITRIKQSALLLAGLFVEKILPQPGVRHQGFGQHLGSSVSDVVPTDVHFGQSGVAAQSAQQAVHGALQLGVAHR